MKAIQMTAVGDPSVLAATDIAKPEIQQPDEILVRLKAAGVNPVDTKLRSNGTYYPDRLPATLGCDGAGIVEAVGSAVSQFKPGDEVYYCYGGIGGHPGNYAEYNTVPEYVVSKKPEAFSFLQAAAAPLVLITAWEALFDQGNVSEGKKVLIHAGAGGVGHVAIQLAKAHGAEVCTTVSSPEKAEFVKSLGTDHVILYKDKNFVDGILDWTGHKGVEVAIDTVGGKTFQDTIHAMAYQGKLVTLLQPAQDTDWKTARLKNLQVGLELMLTPMFQNNLDALQHHGEILSKCTKLAEQDKLSIQLAAEFTLEEAAKAHEVIGNGHTQGKIVLNID